jgi:ABC-type enterochelin transport system permease subunit
VPRKNEIAKAHAIIVSVFVLYTFIFVFNNGMGWKIVLIMIGIGWLLSAISGFLKALKK